MATATVPSRKREQANVIDGAMAINTPHGTLLLRRREGNQWQATWRALLSADDQDLWDWLLEQGRVDPGLRSLGRRLERWLSGDASVEFGDVATPEGPTFHRACWEACRRIGRGQTITYAQLARRSGSPMAMRAAGQAMKSNPLPIVVPCHRVVASDGTLGGYSGTRDQHHPALAIKRALLRMEGAVV